MTEIQDLPPHLSARITEDERGCWIWRGAKASAGYGTVGWKGKTTLVHRLAWELSGKDLPSRAETGLMLDHLCRVRICCNPEHLELVDNKTNAQRGEREFYSQGYCGKGHELAVVGKVMDGRGWRCRECKRIKDRRYKLKTRHPALWQLLLASAGDEQPKRSSRSGSGVMAGPGLNLGLPA